MRIIETITMLTREEGIEIDSEKGIEIGMVKSLSLNTDFDVAKIAKLCDVSESFVIQIQKEQQLR